MRLGKGFVNLNEGKDQTLLISKVDYDPKYDKCKVTFKDEETGGTCTESYNFDHEVALNVFTTLAMCAMNDFTMREQEFDPETIEGCYIVGDVTKDTVEFDDGGKGTFYHVRNFRVAKDDADEDIDSDALFD